MGKREVRGWQNFPRGRLVSSQLIVVLSVHLLKARASNFLQNAREVRTEEGRREPDVLEEHNTC